MFVCKNGSKAFFVTICIFLIADKRLKLQKIQIDERNDSRLFCNSDTDLEVYTHLKCFNTLWRYYVLAL